MFDRYREKSIKTSSRTRRSQNVRAIRRVIEGRLVPLPSNWQAFLVLGDNKADLARFLSEEVITMAPEHKVIVVSGGFKEEDEVRCSDTTVEVDTLKCNHEEADTCIVLHVIHNNEYAQNVVVLARDTDVLLLLLAHRNRITSTVWIAAGTAKKPRFIPLSDVYSKLPEGSEKAILQFHAITGCDTTSYLFGHSKKTAWNVLKDYFHLLLSEGTLTTEKLEQAETFVCRLNKTNVSSVDMALFLLFAKVGTPDKLPPTSDALKYHTMRAHYQAMVWRQAHCQMQILPKPEEFGWKLMDDKLVPVLMTLDPIPKACVEMITCKCTTGCATRQCKCRKANIVCSGLCFCDKSENDLCINKLP